MIVGGIKRMAMASILVASVLASAPAHSQLPATPLTLLAEAIASTAQDQANSLSLYVQYMAANPDPMCQFGDPTAYGTAQWFDPTGNVYNAHDVASVLASCSSASRHFESTISFGIVFQYFHPNGSGDPTWSDIVDTVRPCSAPVNTAVVGAELIPCQNIYTYDIKTAQDTVDPYDGTIGLPHRARFYFEGVPSDPPSFFSMPWTTGGAGCEAVDCPNAASDNSCAIINSDGSCTIVASTSQGELDVENSDQWSLVGPGVDESGSASTHWAGIDLVPGGSYTLTITYPPGINPWTSGVFTSGPEVVPLSSPAGQPECVVVGPGDCTYDSTGNAGVYASSADPGASWSVTAGGGTKAAGAGPGAGTIENLSTNEQVSCSIAGGTGGYTMFCGEP